MEDDYVWWFYNTCERVRLGGVKGDVLYIGVLRTTRMELADWIDNDLYNGRIVFISNSYVLKESVFNYFGNFFFLGDKIKLPVKYGKNYIRARKRFTRC